MHKLDPETPVPIGHKVVIVKSFRHYKTGRRIVAPPGKAFRFLVPE